MLPDHYKRQAFRARLADMSDEEIHAALDTGTIAREWKRCLAESILARREQQRAAQRAQRRWTWTLGAALAAASFGLGVSVSLIFG